jgi:hypothetical protein
MNPGVDLQRCGCIRHQADSGDHIALDADIRVKPRRARTVDDLAPV